MKLTRRKLRNYLGNIVGIQADMHVWWTPELPLIYVSNPKAGCSTIKQSLKNAQADAYAQSGRAFERVESPHADDACLRRKGLPASRCRDRYLFTCVRNPFARALSGYLDKVENEDIGHYLELRGLKPVSFEGFLRALAAYDPKNLDDHFRPQHINLNYPKVAYDAVFYLENPAAIAGFLAQISPGFRLERFAPHARGAAEKLAAYYNPTTIELVRQIYEQDFDAFRYSRELKDALLSPGAMIAEGRLLADGKDPLPPPNPRRQSRDTKTLENTLRCRWLIERRLI